MGKPTRRARAADFLTVGTMLGIPAGSLSKYTVAADRTLLVAPAHGPQVASVAARIMSDGSGSLLLPVDPTAELSAVDELLDAVVRWFRKRQVSRVQTLDVANRWAAVLGSHGFEHHTDLVTLQIMLRPWEAMPTRTNISIEPIPCRTTERLVQLVRSSYGGSMDLPRMRDSWDPISSLSLHEEQSHHDGRWWVVKCDDHDAGVLLFGDARDGQRDLLYFGIAPPMRGRGNGSDALQLGLYELHRQSIQSIQAHVDVENDPAIACYASAGFFEVARAGLFNRVWHSDGLT